VRDPACFERVVGAVAPGRGDPDQTGRRAAVRLVRVLQAPPLVYSTELARSVKLAYAAMVGVDIDPGAARTLKKYRAANVDIKAAGTGQDYRPLPRTPISTDLIYGLVNIRTDGVRILCATMEEKGGDFDVKVFRA
jgi:hypothetical protein